MSKATKKPKTTKKSSVVKEPKVLKDNARLRKKPEYKSFRLHKKVKRPDLKIPSWYGITKKAMRLIKVNAKPIGWFFIIYGLLYLIFVRGIVSPVNIDSVRDEINVATDSSASSIVTNVTVMSVLLSSVVNSGGEVAGLYQLLFLTISTLALIWLFRQQQAGNKVSIKEAYYRGMYPLVPFVIIIVVIGLQTIPATIGNFLFTTVTSTGIAVSAFEQLIWVLLLFTTILLSLYMISSSLVALFIVTLPDMSPSIAMKKAKDLVTFRRINVLSKVIALIIVAALIYVSIVLPAIYISAALAQFLFFAVTVLIVPFVVAYLFVLYRELL